jgi:hypothetical protein
VVQGRAVALGSGAGQGGGVGLRHRGSFRRVVAEVFDKAVVRALCSHGLCLYVLTLVGQGQPASPFALF